MWVHSFNHGKNNAAQHNHEKEIHQEKEHRTFQSDIIFRYEIVEENRVVEKIYSPRNKEKYFNMTKKNKHKPSKSDAWMHIAKQPIPFPEFDMQQTITKNISNVFV